MDIEDDVVDIDEEEEDVDLTGQEELLSELEADIDEYAEVLIPETDEGDEFNGAIEDDLVEEKKPIKGKVKEVKKKVIYEDDTKSIAESEDFEYEDEEEYEDDAEPEGLEDIDMKSKIKNIQINTPFMFKPSDTDESVSITIAKPHERKTSHILTKYEYSAAISTRSSQIQKNPTTFIIQNDSTPQLSDPIELATHELLSRRCPLQLVRYLTSTYAEIWDPNEMAFPQ